MTRLGWLCFVACLLTFTGIVWGADSWEDQAKAGICQHYGLSTADIQIVVLSPIPEWAKGKSFYPVLNQWTKRVGLTTIPLACPDSPKLWTPTIRVHVWLPVARTIDTILKGHPIEPNQFAIVTADITYELDKCQWIQRITDVKNCRATRYIPKGEILGQEMFEVIPDILAQDRITVIADWKGIRTETTGIAVTDGAIGQVISVKIADSSSEFQAHIIDKTHVRVVF